VNRDRNRSTATAGQAQVPERACTRAAGGRGCVVLLLLGVLLAACAGPDHPGAGGAALFEMRTGRAFADVLFELEFAITERNYRITGRNDIGQGLRDRGHASPEIAVVHFCSLESAREILLLDPGYVTQMPCRITVREDGDEVVISAILLPEDHADARVKAFARDTNAMLRDIVAYAAHRRIP